MYTYMIDPYMIVYQYYINICFYTLTVILSIPMLICMTLRGVAMSEDGVSFIKRKATNITAPDYFKND